MKSRAHFKGHPLHPILIAFPIAFLYGSVLADVAGRVLDSPRCWTVGAYASIAAVVSGLVAAVPGLVDYFAVVPPQSSARKRATQHMVVNVAALVIFAIGYAFRDWDTLRPAWTTIGFEIAGVALVTVGGWLGGTLVYRNQIGVDHRYAHAGKWREQTIEGEPGQTITLDHAADLQPGQMRLLHWRDRRLVLARTDTGYAVFDDRCTHRGGPLADGALACGTVQCPWHGSQFDVATGQVKAGPAKTPITAYRAEERDGEVHLTLPA